MRKPVALLFALLTLVSCSEAGTDAPSAAPSSQEGEEAAGDRKDAQPDERGDEEPRKKKVSDKPDGGEADNPSGDGSRRDSGGSEDDGGQGRNAFNDSGSEDDGSSAAFPAPGNYLYAQSGFEKFCAGGRCERQALPKQQTARISVTSRSGEGATVVTEASSSDDRVLRTTTDYNDSHALITEVYTRLSYEGFVFENEYHPAPPVESLRFPLRDGAAWKGSWEDSTSGNYEVRIFGPTSLSVAGRARRAFQVATTTRFKGEFNGEAKTLTWIDPATKAVVKLSGSADLTSTYGRYITEFSTSLRSGPGY